MGAPERKAPAAEPGREDPLEDPLQEGEVRERSGGDVVFRGPVRQGGQQGDQPPQQGGAQEGAAGEGAHESEQGLTNEAVRKGRPLRFPGSASARGRSRRRSSRRWSSSRRNRCVRRSSRGTASV